MIEKAAWFVNLGDMISALYCIYVVSAVDEPRRYFCIHRKNRVPAYRFGEHRNKVRNS